MTVLHYSIKKQKDSWTLEELNIVTTKYKAFIKIIDEKFKSTSLNVRSIFLSFDDMIKYHRSFKIADILSKEYGDLKNAIPTIFFGPLELKNLERIDTLDKRVRFLDSSIWFHFVPLLSNKSFPELLENKVNDIKLFYDLGLYSLLNAKEYLHLQLRRQKNNWIYTNKAEGHGEFVYPYVCHSESEFRDKLLLADTSLFTKYNLKWDILLIDDHAITPLSRNTGKLKQEINKLNILTGIVKHWENASKNLMNISLRERFNFYTAEDLSSAKTELSRKCFDIVLLDYLLGKKPGNENEREYSYELLVEMDEYFNKKDDKAKFIEGPMGNHWLLNISSFSDAFMNKLQEKGLSHNSPYWFLGRGADMINTPYLFLYKLFMLMQHQFFMALGWSLKFDKKDGLKQEIRNLVDLIINPSINGDIEKDENEQRKQWISNFSKVAGIFLNLNQLSIDSEVGNNSTFAGSVLDFFNNDKSDSITDGKKQIEILSHYRELLYALSFHSLYKDEGILIETERLKELIGT